MREQIAPRELVPQAELGPQRPEALEALPIALIAVLDLDDKVVVRVALEAGEPVAGDLVLEVDLGHGRAVVVRVQALLGRGMLKPDDHPVRDVRQLVLPVRRVCGVPRGHVEHPPVVVVIPVWVKCDLLLVAPAGVVVRV